MNDWNASVDATPAAVEHPMEFVREPIGGTRKGIGHMDTTKTPTGAEGVIPGDESDKAETQLLSLIGNVIHVANEARKLDEEDAKGRHLVSADALRSGSRGERHLHKHLATLQPTIWRILLVLVHLGRKDDVSRLQLFEVDEQFEQFRDEWVFVELLEAQPCLGDHLHRGSDRARRRGVLRKLAKGINESHTVSRATDEAGRA